MSLTVCDESSSGTAKEDSCHNEVSNANIWEKTTGGGYSKSAPDPRRRRISAGRATSVRIEPARHLESSRTIQRRLKDGPACMRKQAQKIHGGTHRRTKPGGSRRQPRPVAPIGRALLVGIYALPADARAVKPAVPGLRPGARSSRPCGRQEMQRARQHRAESTGSFINSK